MSTRPIPWDWLNRIHAPGEVLSAAWDDQGRLIVELADCFVAYRKDRGEWDAALSLVARWIDEDERAARAAA